jgi:sialate O-acetylesterase
VEGRVHQAINGALLNMNHLLLMIAVVALLPGASLAKVLTLPRVFCDHMMLQRELPVPVWGTANAGDEITISFAGQKKKCLADANGNWIANLDPMPASAEPRELNITANNPESGTTTLKCADVLVGEVWLCSGQSNMHFIMGERDKFPGVERGDEEIAKPERPGLRIFSDDGDKVWENRGWQRCGGEALARFSATAFFFGNALHRDLQVPVGLINISRDGTTIQVWTRREFALRNPFTRHYVELEAKHRDEILAFTKAQRDARLARQSGRTDVKEPVPLKSEVEISRFARLSKLYNSLVEPLAPYTLRGVIWYQGESNCSSFETAQAYGSMLPDLIEGWRDRWQQPQMPWYVMQLPCYAGAESANWPWVRQGQWEAAHTQLNVGLANYCDVADATLLHPPQKLQAGERLARLALAKTYGKAIPCEGPKLKSLRREAASLVAEFDDGGAAITLKGGSWNDVELAGNDGVYHPAKATFKGAIAMITCDVVSVPKAIRYGWRAVFTPSLFNGAGLPAAPFAMLIGNDGKLQPGVVAAGRPQPRPL